MKRSEIVTGTSVKYEALRLTDPKTNKVMREGYTLIGMLMTLPMKGKASYKGSPLQEVPGTFVGYIKGSSQLKTMHVFLVASDEEVIRLTNQYRNYEFLYININQLSATRMPKKVSDYLKKLHKKYQSEAKLKLELERLQAVKDQNQRDIVNLSEEIKKDLEKTIKVDYSSLPNMEVLELVERGINKHKLNKDLVEIVAVDNNGEQNLTIMLDFESLYNPKEFELYEDGDGGVSAESALTKEETFKLLASKERYTVNRYKEELSKVSGIQFIFDLETEISDDFTVYMLGYFKIKITNKAHLDETISKLARIFTNK